jgi:uncharacterized OsmC-like protein
MAPVRAKEFRYAVGLERSGRVVADGTAPLDLAPAWTPEHLVLAGLVRCTITSLRHHAQRAGIDLLAAGSASGMVTKRNEDERYAFVEIDVRLEIELDPKPPGDELETLLARAEWDCFVGASLTVKPTYEWTVR